MVNIDELYKYMYNKSCDNFVEVKRWLKNGKM